MSLNPRRAMNFPMLLIVVLCLGIAAAFIAVPNVGPQAVVQVTASTTSSSSTSSSSTTSSSTISSITSSTISGYYVINLDATCFTSSTTITGQVLTAGSTQYTGGVIPASGVTLQLVVANLGNGPPVPLQTVTTDSNGRFSFTPTNFVAPFRIGASDASGRTGTVTFNVQSSCVNPPPPSAPAWWVPAITGIFLLVGVVLIIRGIGFI